ncbi:MAG: hypothetical protein RMJ34_03335 [candidate division WOR-3 bacterium]|nr:hypothetical protein [candidate division WOR-3 bacterium]
MINNHDIITKMRVLESFSVLYRSFAISQQSLENIKDILLNNPKEALKFFLTYAYGGRQGVPKWFLLIAIHCIEDVYEQNDELAELEEEIQTRFLEYHGSANPSRNPLFSTSSRSSAISAFNFNDIWNHLQNGEVSTAYNSLIGINGIGPKIAAYFLRDVVDFFGIDISNWKEENFYNFYYLQPIDIWIKTVAHELSLQVSDSEIPSNMEAGERDHRPYIVGICNTCLSNNINPLRFNQGSWFFASMICGTPSVLTHILHNFSPQQIIERALSFKIVYTTLNWQEFEEQVRKIIQEIGAVSQ